MKKHIQIGIVSALHEFKNKFENKEREYTATKLHLSVHAKKNHNNLFLKEL